MGLMLTICGYGVCLFMGLLCVTLLWFIWTDRINLTLLLAEASGDASMSRLQLLIFTLVVAISLFMLVERGTKFPDIPNGILTLLGISASTYAVGKGISYSRDEGVTTRDERETERARERAATERLSATGAASITTPEGVAAKGAADPVKPVIG